MAKKKKRAPAKKKTPRSRARKKGSRYRAKAAIGKPDESVLADYSPTDPASSHPEWVKSRFPSYVTPHAGHEATAVREFSHAGHNVKIITTYRVEVDGQPVRAHLSVDEDGRVYTHATPFVTYASANDLMKAVIDTYPDSFSGQAGRHDGGHHGGAHHGGHS